MNENKNEARLAALMEEALSAGLELQRFSEENFPVFQGDDEKKIGEVLAEREKLIRRLVDLEKEIGLVSDSLEGGPPKEGRMPEFFENRRRLRRVLDSVMETDERAKKLLEQKIRDYKAKTVSARNRKHVSAYIESSVPDMPDNMIEYIN
ncbi:MAG: hypothetical protein ACOX7I_06860 [Oscillospiraceae bacterium]|jgi:hypothetical protein